jgi:transposase-like protein
MVFSMEKQNLFKWKHYQLDIILLTVEWYLQYNLSFRILVEMMEERGLLMAHTTIMRWVHQYSPEFRQATSPSSKTYKRFMESGRSVYQSKRAMDVSVSFSGF